MCYAWMFEAGAQGAQTLQNNPDAGINDSGIQKMDRIADPFTSWLSTKIGDPGNLFGHKGAVDVGKLLSDQLAERESEINAQASEQMGDLTRKAWAQRAHMIVAAGEAGVGGNSVQAQLQNNLTQQTLAKGEISLNADLQKKAALLDAQNAAAGHATASTAGAGLQIGAQGFDDYERYQEMNTQ